MAALRSYSKSLTRGRRPASAPPASGRADGSPSPFPSRAASPLPAQDASPFPSRASSPMPGGRGNKRKAMTPTASVTDLESLERTLLQQQAAQQAAAAMVMGSGAVARGGGGSRPRRPPPRPVAAPGSWGSRAGASPSAEQAASMDWGMRPASAGPLPALGLPPLPPGVGSAAAVLPPSRLAEPYSPLKIRPLVMGGSVLDCGPLVTAPGLPMASPPPPPLIWPQPSRAAMFSPPLPSIHQQQPELQGPQDRRQAPASMSENCLSQAEQGREWHSMVPTQQQQQQQVGQPGQPKQPAGRERPTLHRRSPSPLLSPGVASRATRELVSIESALRSLADDVDEHAI